LLRGTTTFRGHPRSSLKTLETIIGPKSLEQFETDWKKWVMALRFGA